MTRRKRFWLTPYYGIGKYVPNRPSSAGKRIRASICSDIFSGFRENANIEKGVVIGTRESIEIGFSSGTDIDVRVGGIGEGRGFVVGDFVLTPPEVGIITANREPNKPDVGYEEQGVVASRVVIDNCVWSGIRTIILPGVNIGESMIIGARSVVAKDVPRNSVAVGDSARIAERKIR